jgi:hypothetical protein
MPNSLYPLSLVNLLRGINILAKAMFEAILIASIIGRSIWPLVDTFTVKYAFRPLSFVRSAVFNSYFASSVRN